MVTTQVPWREVRTAGAAEEITRLADQMRDLGVSSAQQQAAWRAVEAKDPKVLAVLEQTAETLDRIQEEQRGQQKRSTATPFNDRRDATLVGTWREAYRTAAEGAPNRAFGACYAAAAVFAGVVFRGY